MRSAKFLLVLVLLLGACANSFASDWSARTSGITNALHRVLLANRRVGYAVGDGGTVIKTSNGGVTWTRLTTGTSASLFGLAMADSDHVWACGANGTVISSHNGGITWAVFGAPTTQTLRALDLYSIYANDTLFAHTIVECAGDVGASPFTVDGGAHWYSNSTGSSANFTGVSDNYYAACLLVGSGGTVLYSTGTSFYPWTSPGTSDIVAFKGGIVPSAITSNAEFVISADGSMSKGVNSGTLAWTSVMPGVSSPQGFDVIHRNRWVVGASGGIRFSPDDGATWSTQTTTTTVTLRSVSMADSTTGCVVGDGGFVATYGNLAGVGDAPRTAAGLALEGVWPDPAVSATSIAWTLARPGPATLRVLDVTGRLVATLVGGEQEAGRHLTRFETRTLSPGVYLCDLSAGGHRVSTRICVVR